MSFLISALFLSASALAATAGSSQETKTDPSLVEVANSEMQSPLVDRLTVESAKKTKNNSAAIAPKIESSQISILKAEDQYVSPRARDYDFRFDLGLESIKLQGQPPQDQMIGADDLENIGQIPMAEFRLGFLQNGFKKISWGLQTYLGYGLKEYSITTPTKNELNPRVNILSYGLSAQVRWNWNDHLAIEGAFAQGPFQIRQTSTQTTLAQWSANTNAQTLRAGIQYQIKPDWETGAHLSQHRLLSSDLSLQSSLLSLSTGVRW